MNLAWGDLYLLLAVLLLLVGAPATHAITSRWRARRAIRKARG